MAITSPKVIAGSGYDSLAIKIAEFPPASTGASVRTAPSSEGLPSANNAMTPKASGVVKL